MQVLVFLGRFENLPGVREKSEEEMTPRAQRVLRAILDFQFKEDCETPSNPAPTTTSEWKRWFLGKELILDFGLILWWCFVKLVLVLCEMKIKLKKGGLSWIRKN